MKPHRRSCRALAATAGLAALIPAALILAATSAAASPTVDPAAAPVNDPHHATVCGSGRGEVTLDVDGKQLSVTRREGDRVTTTVVDMDEVGRMVGDAMAAVKDLQLQVRVGQDNRVNVTTSDGSFEVDLDQIMNQVAAAVRTGLNEVDTSTWTSTGTGAGTEEDLQRELTELQREMRGLREELRRLRDNAGRAPAVPAAPSGPQEADHRR